MDLAIPAFGYQSHIGAGRRHRLIRTSAVQGRPLLRNRMIGAADHGW